MIARGLLRAHPSLAPESPLWRLLAAAAAAVFLSTTTDGATYRWANTSNRIYVENGGTATLTEIKAALPNAPLDLVDPVGKIWLLRANLVIEDGCTLNLHGAAVGGDVNELRILSRNSAAAGSVVIIDADWGTLDLKATRATSWDDTLGGPDTEIDTYKRAFIRARSRSSGALSLESTLNIVDSDIGYLGYNFKEGFGLTWQNVTDTPGLQVFGTVANSRIHHSKLDVSTWTADSVTWSGNEIDANNLVGFKPNDPAHQDVLATNSVHDNEYGATLRWAPTAKFIYVTGPGFATPSDIRNALPEAPLDLVNPAQAIWLLRANLEVEEGGTLLVHGTTIGGDANEFRLLSRNSSAPDSVVSVDADYGVLDFRSTKVTSWDDVTAGPDTEYITYKRAFLRARSRLDGTTAQESTLNIIDSEVAYLGYNFREGYSLVWQSIPPSSGLRVFGNILGSHLHDSLIDVSTWSADDVTWIGNEVDHATLFGFKASDPDHQAALAQNNVHDTVYGATLRWAESIGRLYVTGPGTATLSDLKSGAPDAPLELVDPVNKIWLLKADLQIEEGAQLNLHGSTLGGDVDELRLLSNNDPLTPDPFVWISADYGTLDIRSTRITSWDEAVGGPDTEYAAYGRAWIRVRSSLAPDGVTARESRMDIVDSDIGYLGYHGSEAYGLVWKVIGTHPDPSKDIFDYVEVYGDILNSRLHHNFFGMYSFGHYGGQWIGNEVDNNVGYGFDPHDDSDHLVIEDNDVHHNGLHGIIASKRCDHLVIRNNRSWSNLKNGIMLHRSCNDSVIEDNQSWNNKDAGIALFGTWRTIVRNNLCISNANAGIRLSVGGGDSVIANNVIRSSGKNGSFFLYKGTDIPEPGDDGRPRNYLIVSNLIDNIVADAVKMQDSEQITLLENTFVGTAPVLRFQDSMSVVVASNSLPADTVLRIAGIPTRPTNPRFIAQGAFAVNINVTSSATFEKPDGTIFDIDEAPGFTTAASSTTGSPSFITLTSALVGTFTHIAPVPLTAISAEVGLLVNPTQWGDLPTLAKEWDINTASGTLPIEFTVGSLAPGVNHKLYVDGIAYGMFFPDPTGTLAFEVTPGTPGLHGFRLVPQ